MVVNITNIEFVNKLNSAFINFETDLFPSDGTCTLIF